MKARVKATGDIVNASYWNTSANGIKYYDIDNSGYTMTEDELDFDLSYTPDYWTRLEHQYAGMAMQGMLNNSLLTTGLLKAGKSHEDFVDEVTGIAIRYAHALVQKLKEKEEMK